MSFQPIVFFSSIAIGIFLIFNVESHAIKRQSQNLQNPMSIVGQSQSDQIQTIASNFNQQNLDQNQQNQNPNSITTNMNGFVGQQSMNGQNFAGNAETLMNILQQLLLQQQQQQMSTNFNGNQQQQFGQQSVLPSTPQMPLPPSNPLMTLLNNIGGQGAQLPPQPPQPQTNGLFGNAPSLTTNFVQPPSTQSIDLQANGSNTTNGNNQQQPNQSQFASGKDNQQGNQGLGLLNGK